jgi:hypothetical protein
MVKQTETDPSVIGRKFIIIPGTHPLDFLTQLL